MDADDEDFVFYGTPIEREEEMAGRKRKAVAEAGQMRSLPPWKQEVRDEEGRKRFHGAFTGGFSAGYYNTVGSKEGWTPQTFTSSRKSRAEVKEQSVYNFLDDDEKAEIKGHALGTSLQFDTFGFTSAELARKQAEKEQHKRPSAIPGPVPDEIVVPATNSIGVKLLLKMGWRHGHSIRDARTNSLYDARREARKAFLAFSCDEERPMLAQFENIKSDSESASEPSVDDVYASRSTPVFVLNPKKDLHGLGYDPFKHAPEFRERNRLLVAGNKVLGNRRAISRKENLFASNSGKVAPGIGIGALEELDIEDEDIYASGFAFEETCVEEVEEPSTATRKSKQKVEKKDPGILSGYKVASSSDYQLQRFDPPIIPLNFEPHHNFRAPLEVETKFTEPPPLEVPFPEDSNLKMLIDGFATLVARCGKLFEDLSREKNKTNPLFCFLTGGNGHGYYARKLWEEQQKRADQKKQQPDIKSIPSVQKLTAESRGRILGERPLERSSKDSGSSLAATDSISLQFHLSDTFMKPVSLVQYPDVAKPFKNDPAKQERFEQFLKDKYEGGLRSTYSGGASNMSETDRARERLDFEATAEAIKKGEWSTEINASEKLMETPISAKMQFISEGVEDNKIPRDEENKTNKTYPRREEYDWRPSPILCKRFDIIDPFMGKPLPLPRVRTKIDSLIFMPDFVTPTKIDKAAAVNRDSSPVTQAEIQAIGDEASIKETEVDPNITSVHRPPVDLYKAIFSDDSDDEGETSSFNQVDVLRKKTEGSNTTLNRLIAGDFLESLGKELGLEVPPVPILEMDKTKTSGSRKEPISTEDAKVSEKERSTSTIRLFNRTSEDKEAADGNLRHPERTIEGASSGKLCKKELDNAVSLVDGNGLDDYGNQDNRTPNMSSWSKATASGYSEQKTQKVSVQKTEIDDKKASRKHSRRHRSRSSTLDGDSSDDSGYRDRDLYRSKSEKRDSSRGKKSRKHSKHHSNKSKESPTRSSRHGAGRERSEDRQERRKSRGRDSVSSKSDAYKKYR